MNATPTPAIFANKKQRPVPAPPKRVSIAQVEATDPGVIVRPGLRDEVVSTIHSGVVKTKHLERGQRVRPFVHDAPRGGERIVDKVTRLDGGAVVEVEWASAHPTSQHKAAYRWYDESLDGATVEHVVKVPGFVSYQEA